jgi:hypothetical protein
LVGIELAENDHKMRRNFNQPLALSDCHDAAGLQKYFLPRTLLSEDTFKSLKVKERFRSGNFLDPQVPMKYHQTVPIAHSTASNQSKGAIEIEELYLSASAYKVPSDQILPFVHLN